MKKVAIIVRTKNEELWISSCLNSLLNQTYKNFEIIVIDNQSDDLTLKILENFPVKVKTYAPKNNNYFPGEALNIGIRAIDADYYAFISAHCIAKDEKWLEEFIYELENNIKFAGVYGKQEPFAYSSAQTKRDLAIAFGSDPITQETDPFFHNANSIIRKEALFPSLFNEKITNIEDRDWATNKIKEGWLLRYSAKSSVYHYHGIHHDNNPSRLLKTANVLEKLNLPEKELESNCFSIAFILSFRTNEIFEGDLAIYSLKELSHSLKEVIGISKNISIFLVSSEKHFQFINKVLLKENLNIKIFHIKRESKLDKKWVSILDVMQYTLEKIKEKKDNITHICYLSPHYLFRNPEDMKSAVKKVKDSYGKSINLTLIFGEEIPNNKYLYNSSEIHDILSESFRPSSTKSNEDKKWRIHSGYCTIFSVKDILSSALFSNEIELIPFRNNISTLRITGDKDLKYILSKLNKV